MDRWQASGTRTLHYSNRNALDGAPRRFMLRRFRLAESRRGKDPAKMDPAQTGERASFGLESAANK
jgi:hypothetical protein